MSVNLSVIIVSWNCKRELLDCVQSLTNQNSHDALEIIIVDNASTDGSVEAVQVCFPTVSIIQTGANLGFAQAANRGLATAQGEYVLFLNPDTLVQAWSLGPALQVLHHWPTIGIVGVQLLNSDGSVQPSCGQFLSVSALIKEKLRHFSGHRSQNGENEDNHLWSSTTIVEPDWITGAFLLCRRTIIQEVGGFDEEYFLYAEDMDLCYRVRQRGYKIVYFPEVGVTHLGNRSGARKWAEQREGEIVRAEILFLRKHSGKLRALGFRCLAGALFFGKSFLFWLRARKQYESYRIEARRYWYMTQVCFGVK
jgi:N-acetylglucosaminyl-diphospho-decaprenol L-rhamnosyltransferase